MSRNLFTATAANLIKTASYTKLHIPFFQRQYVWSKDNWEELFNTFLEERTPFIGSIIVKQLQNRNNEVDVIDGQQRLTTLSILIKAFYDSLNIEDKKTAYNNILTIFYSSKSILSKEYSLRLNHSRLDRNDFENIMSFDYSLKDGCTSNEIGIIGCYNYFFNRISSLKLEDYQKFLNMFEKLTDEKFSYLVLIQLSSEADEQTIFDTLNTTGVMLTASDTIKNVIYKTLGKMYEDEDFIEPQEKLINFYVKTWENIFESESNKDYWNSTLVTGRFNRTYLEFFLYCYGVLSGIYTSYDNKINDLSSVYKAYLKKVSTSNELEEFLLRMVDYAQTFKNGFKYGVNNKYYTYKRDDVLDRLLQFLYITDTTSVYPYVIKILYDYKNDNHKMNVQLHKLEKMLVINHLTANSTKTKNYNKLVMSLISDPSKIDIELADIKNNKNYVLLKKPSNKVANMYLFWIELYKRQDQKKGRRHVHPSGTHAGYSGHHRPQKDPPVPVRFFHGDPRSCGKLLCKADQKESGHGGGQQPQGGRCRLWRRHQRGHLHHPGRHPGAAFDEQGRRGRCHSGRDPAAAGKKVILPGFCCTHITKSTKDLWFFPKIRPYLFILCCKNYIIRVCPHIWKESVCAAAVNIWRRALLCSCTRIIASICWTM